MQLVPGTTLEQYEILSSIGAGGMGEVYRARDTKLGREVAIKVLLDEVSSDPERVARFEREARVLASLNHRNIATLHGFESEGETSFLVMELVDGETLADRIKRGSIPVEEALPLFVQIAEGLEAAHEKGVIHRDLKPANIKVSVNGEIKILDFGLAKAMSPDGDGLGDASASMSPTLTLAATQRGEILGTAAYMSPEQAQAKPVDKRTDIWAFGVCLWEALVGDNVFEGENVSMILARVLDRQPDWDRLPKQLPWRVREVLRRCLEKDPERRLHDVADARLELEEALVSPESQSVEATAPAPRPRALLLIAAAAVAASLGLATWSLTRPERQAPEPLSRFVIGPPESEPLHLTVVHTDLAVSPDGTSIVYTVLRDGDRQLYLRSLGELEAIPLRGTERGVGPFFSPDGKWVGFYDQRSLKKVRIDGGSVVTICDAAEGVQGASWAANDTIVFAGLTPGTGLYRVSAGGGEPKVLTTPDTEKGAISHVLPAVLPRDRGVLFTVLSGDLQRVFGDPTRRAVSAGRIAVLDLETGVHKTLVREGGSPRYSQTGHLLYGVNGTLQAAPFDLERLEVTGDPLPVIEGIVTKATGAVAFAFSPSGTLAYVAGGQVDRTTNLTLGWIDRDGQWETIPAELGIDPRPRVSPDGGRIAFEIQNPTGTDIFIFDLERNAQRRFTFGTSFNSFPLWTPDGKGLVFSSTRDGALNLYLKAADGIGAAERLTTSPNEQIAHSWSADATTLLFSERGTETDTWDVLILALEGERAAQRLLDSEFDEVDPQVSPDGRWIAYASNESAKSEIFVRPFPDVQAGKWQVSTDGGMLPKWSPDGRELFYRGVSQARYAPFATAGDMMVVAIETASTFTQGNPEILFETEHLRQRASFYDVSPDGGRFLMVSVSEPADLPIHLVLNWFEELDRLVPIN